MDVQHHRFRVGDQVGVCCELFDEHGCPTPRDKVWTVIDVSWSKRGTEGYCYALQDSDLLVPRRVRFSPASRDRYIDEKDLLIVAEKPT